MLFDLAINLKIYDQIKFLARVSRVLGSFIIMGPDHLFYRRRLQSLLNEHIMREASL